MSGGYVTSLEPYDGHWEYMLDQTVRVTAVNPGFGGGTLANFKAEMLGVVSLNLADVGKFSLAIPIRYYFDQEQAFRQRSLVSQKPWLGFYPHLLAWTCGCRRSDGRKPG